MFLFSAWNGNLEVSVYFLRVKRGYAFKIEEAKWIEYMLISAAMKFSNKRKFWYGIPAYTDPFLALVLLINQSYTLTITCIIRSSVKNLWCPLSVTLSAQWSQWDAQMESKESKKIKNLNVVRYNLTVLLCHNVCYFWYTRENISYRIFRHSSDLWLL
jgi:hypothetical protein